MDQKSTEDFKKIPKLSMLVKAMIWLFALNLLVERGLQLLPIYTLGDNFSLSNTLGTSLRLPFFWTGLLVPILYLRALWAATDLLKKYELSLSFDSLLFRELQTLGTYLMYAAMAAILFVPTMEAWFNQGSHRLSWDWNIEAASVGMIGMILKFITQNSKVLKP
ncbi:hypothetical protein [Undibacterium sp. Ji22W]|uniref:hypothetical protein n=1 Tax=Undibacterium sp. Ji22W TaxID=3413038 RepID=UPI003BF0FD79